jgi:glycosyltransferase involved in cell wall biosynthesis
MRFLLSYSADHFDPNLPVEEHDHWGTSANVISRTLYAALARHGDVTFIDATEPERVSSSAFDVFVGIQRNFGEILDACTADRSILIAVNMHPAEHNRLLLDFVVREELPASALHALDLHDVDRRARALDAADSILLFGNAHTLGSYTRHGIPGEKIELINYGVDVGTDRAAAPSPQGAPETQILYCASEIGLRKGFDIVAALADDLPGLGAHLHIAGAASYPHYRATLDELEDRPHVTNHGWLKPTSAEYRDLLEGCDYLLFPSLEEGQAGTVLDAMACGVIPLISPHCGVDLAPLGFCELETASARNRELLRRACALPESERARLRRKTIEYYDELHAGFDQRLEASIHDLLDRTAANGHHSVRHVPAAGNGRPPEGIPLRQRARRRYLVTRARWLSHWRFHLILGGIRRRLPI